MEPGLKPPPASEVFLAPGALVPAATAAAQAGPEHVLEPTAYDAILLAGFGGPEGQDDVIPFLRNVTAGRGIPDERLEEVAHHYRHYGGISPINEHNRQLKAALEAELAGRGIDLPVYWGNRNWAPYVPDALREAHTDGHRRLLAIPTSAYSSYSSCRQYREDIADALEATGLGADMQVDKVRQYFDHPGFVTPFCDAVAGGLAELRERGATAIEVLFATHSIPTADAERSGPAALELGDGGAYAAQHRAVAEVVMEAIGEQGTPWQVVYQSRSGPSSQPWLEPDVNDAIAALATPDGEGANRRDGVVIVPLGFLSDHMEVLWDLDNEAMETATEHGLAAVRVATPGIHPAFVAGLVDLVVERVQGTPVAERPAQTDLGPWYDVCRPGCCENVRRGFRPAVAGVQP
ncbi:ferrochelatase [Ruania halotolerans]|uniref:ferrochelatase n=1 Tax=Ruania halotolerans TaxID=2897773 RepID=UPI001E5CC4C9|nr:ferrochelatase [Ruania halotolerans]UFU08344.1 ferrochelatase [Ruania halotolerans]